MKMEEQKGRAAEIRREKEQKNLKSEEVRSFSYVSHSPTFLLIH